MSIKKIVLVLAVALGLLNIAHAITPKTEVKLAAKTEAKTQDVVNTYYVISQTGSNYNISTTPPSGSPCGPGSKPCEFTTELTLGSTVPTTDVDNEEGDIHIEANRISVPLVP